MENRISILYVGNTQEVADQLALSPDILLTVKPNLLAADFFLKNEQKPDVIISEYSISDGNGMEFHGSVRSNEEFNRVVFILLSHEFENELFVSAFKNRVDDFFVLPLPRTDDFLSRIRFLKEYRNKYPLEKPEFKMDIEFQMPLSKRIFDLIAAIVILWILLPIILASCDCDQIGIERKSLLSGNKSGTRSIRYL